MLQIGDERRPVGGVVAQRVGGDAIGSGEPRYLGVKQSAASISDHNLLDFGDDVVIGADVHVSGHTVEAGVVKTGPVRLGRNVTIGLSSVIEIDVVIGDDAQVGALSFVPKHTVLEPRRVYAGIPVTPLRRHTDAEVHGAPNRDARARSG